MKAMRDLGKFIALGLLPALLVGCASLESTSSRLENNEPPKAQILGAWYYHMGRSGFVKLDLKEGGVFEVSVLSIEGRDEKRATGGSWSLSGKKFELVWPDGTSKKQTLVSVSDEVLLLGNTKEISESYHRKPTKRPRKRISLEECSSDEIVPADNLENHE